MLTKKLMADNKNKYKFYIIFKNKLKFINLTFSLTLT